MSFPSKYFKVYDGGRGWTAKLSKRQLCATGYQGLHTVISTNAQSATLPHFVCVYLFNLQQLLLPF